MAQERKSVAERAGRPVDTHPGIGWWLLAAVLACAAVSVALSTSGELRGVVSATVCAAASVVCVVRASRGSRSIRDARPSDEARAVIVDDRV